MIHIREYIIGSLFTMIVFAIGIMYLAAIPSPPAGAHVNYTLIYSSVWGKSVCPGDIAVNEIRAKILFPTVVDVVVGFQREDGSNVVGLDTLVGTRLFPIRTEFDQVVEWTVPDLEPGHYHRVTAFVARFADVEPWFVTIDFDIAEDCGDG